MNAVSPKATSATRGVTRLGVLSAHTEQILHSIGQRRSWASGRVLLSRGQVAETAILVLSGRLRVVTISPDGEEHLLRWLEPGEVTGLSSVMAESPFPADLIATGPTVLLHIDRQRLVSLIQSDGEVALTIVRVLSMRVNQLIDMIAEHALVSLEHKVLAALDRLAQYHGTPVTEGILLRVSQSDIANTVAASRQRVNLQLQKLQKRGVLKLGYRSIVLLRKAETERTGSRR